MYNQSTREALLTKVDYELWFLDFIATKSEALTGGASLDSLSLTSRRDLVHRNVFLVENIGASQALEVVNAMSPLTLVISFKIFDMIFEWILEENCSNEQVQIKNMSSGLRFKDKLQILSSPSIVYPPLMAAEPWLRDYMYAIYKNLTKYRNEIIHRNNFRVTSDGTLSVEHATKGRVYHLDVDREALGAFVRVAVAVAKILSGTQDYSAMVESLLKYNLGKLESFHLLPGFSELPPLKIAVNYLSYEEAGSYPVDLAYVREVVRAKFPNQNVFFELTVNGIVDDGPSGQHVNSADHWYFPSEAVPSEKGLILGVGSYEEYRIA